MKICEKLKKMLLVILFKKVIPHILLFPIRHHFIIRCVTHNLSLFPCLSLICQILHFQCFTLSRFNLTHLILPHFPYAISFTIMSSFNHTFPSISLVRPPVVNFINILQAAFAPIFLRKKIAKTNCN